MIDKQKIKLINKCIHKIAQGDAQSLETLFNETKKYFYVVARSYLNDKSKAEDVLSASYYKVAANAKSFDPKKNGYNWIFEIVKNTALNQNNSDRAKPADYLENCENLSYDPIDEVLDKIMVQEASSVLSGEEKTIIYLYFYENNTLQEIADKLKKPKSTVAYTLKNILKKMKKYLE